MAKVVNKDNFDSFTSKENMSKTWNHIETLYFCMLIIIKCTNIIILKKFVFMGGD